ncbi:MAG: peptidase [Pirellulales bacterium]|nr:peptidase [Pirellulales bacterium]
MRGLIFLCLSAMMTLTLNAPVRAAEGEPGQEPATRRAVMIEFHEAIEPLSGELLKRKFSEAIDSGAEVIILDIDSPGGWTLVTFELMDMVMEADEVETVAFIENAAISGAALLSLACDRIIMLPRARMGDAGEIVLGPDGMFRYVEAKNRSNLAQRVRDAAQANGRPMALAEKMVDKDMVVFAATHKHDGTRRFFSDRDWESFPDADNWERGKPVREAGQEMFFTVNGQRAVELGMADQTIENREQLAETLRVSTPITVMERSWVDTLILVLNSWFVTFLLILIGLIALVIEFSAPGLGIGGLTSLLCFSLFFWSRFLGETSGWLEVILFAIGLTFIAAEMFVIPGFGIAGISGITLMLSSLVMASRRVLLPENPADLTSLGWDVLTVLGAFVGFLVVLMGLAHYIGEIPGLSRLTLKPPISLEGAVVVDVDSEALLPGWQRVAVGDVGSAISPLRPSGKMQVDDYVVDVVTEGDFVENGSQVRVVGKQGARVVVRPV